MNSMINLDYKSRIPIYEQIVNEIERFVALSILKPGEQILSIRELALRLGINPNTVKKAYSILESKGVIQTISTKGTFIADTIDQVVEQKIDKIEQEIVDRIKELETLGLSKKEIQVRLNQRGVL